MQSSPRSGSTKYARTSAFTLMELIIVIAIIGILAAILFPVLNRSKEKSRRTACLSNERQLSTAWLMYSQDNDGRVVPWSVSGRSASDAFVWDQLIKPYHKNDKVMQCPASAALVSYTYSANVGGASPSPPARNLASLKNPAQTPIIADCEGFPNGDNNVEGWSYSFVIPDERGGYQSRAIKYVSFQGGHPTGERQWFAPPTADRTAAATIKSDQHDGGANYIFADGHTKWVQGDKDSMGKSIPARKGMDYDSDGTLGDDPAGGTSGKYD